MLATRKLNSSNKLEKFSAVFLNLLGLSILGLIGYIVAHGGDVTNQKYYLTIGMFMSFIVGCDGILDEKSKKEDLGTYQWFLARLNIRQSRLGESASFLLAMVTLMTFLIFTMVYYILEAHEEAIATSPYQISYEQLSIALISCVVLIITLYFYENLSDVKVSEKEILLIDDVVGVDEKTKNEFKKLVVEKIQSQGYVNRENIYQLSENIRKHLHIKKIREEKKGKKEALAEKAKEYSNLINSVSKE